MIGKCIGAYTPSNRGEGYDYYPPFVNFSQVDDKVKITVRSRDRINEQGHPETIAHADMEITTQEFRKLLEGALSQLT